MADGASEPAQGEAAPPSKCPHPEAVGTRYGDPLSAERQAELQNVLDTWNASGADHEGRRGPFDGVRLTGADVSWLAEQSGRGGIFRQVPNLHLEWADLNGAHLEGAGLREAHLDNAHLRGVYLEGSELREAHLKWGFLELAHLKGADLYEAHLEGANLFNAYLEAADLSRAHLEDADLGAAHLEGTRLQGVHMEGTRLNGAHMEGTHLNGAHLEGANLSGAHLDGKTYQPDSIDFLRNKRWDKTFQWTLRPADLQNAVFDAATTLNNITLGDAAHGAVRVADVRWGGANLAVVDWIPLIEPRTELGDERAARYWKPEPFKSPEGKPSRQELHAARAKYEQEQAKAKLETFRAAVRANRQLAAALRDQGMNEEADRFAYRAQVIQRQVFRQQGKRGRATLSWFLDIVAGHGYRPERSLYTYMGVILLFALLYLLAGNGLLTFGLPASQYAAHGLPWYEALILSISSFHGRGFFQPLQTPGDPVAIIASVEAIFGLFIEVSFIATFTQRFFGK